MNGWVQRLVLAPAVTYIGFNMIGLAKESKEPGFWGGLAFMVFLIGLGLFLPNRKLAKKLPEKNNEIEDLKKRLNELESKNTEKQ